MRQLSNKVVVTGGAGFIGSHIADALIELNKYVIVIDDLSTGKLDNIRHLSKSNRFEFINGSVTDLKLLQSVFPSVEYVFHHAAIASVSRSIENPLVTHEVNTTGTLNVLLAARDNGVKKVVFASSSAVYGDRLDLPKTEEMLPDPKSPYAVSKLAAEHYCDVFQRQYNLPTVMLRYFNVYGPRQDASSEYSGVIPRFISRVAGGDRPVIFGDGEQTRDFVYVQDVVKANLMAIETEATGALNIGTGRAVSLNTLATLITGLCGGAVTPAYKKARKGDIKHSVADISMAKSIGYDPQYDLRKGLAETVKSFTRL